MDDRDLEALLGRYRARGPSANLRRAVLSIAVPCRSWPWVAAAAVLFLTTVGLSRAGDRLRPSSYEPRSAVERSIADDPMLGSIDSAELNRALSRAALLSAIEQRDVSATSVVPPWR